ncbi:MAG: Uma2 family endonuclease, partial [Pseudomonadota bacterium]|nr:Uma2 family endonuclease [Pseudomonadota bacterium]
YRRLDSLAEYLLAAQDRARLEHYRRQPDGQWLFTDASGLDATLPLPAIDGGLALAEVYDKVELHGDGPGHPPAAG